MHRFPESFTSNVPRYLVSPEAEKPAFSAEYSIPEVKVDAQYGMGIAVRSASSRLCNPEHRTCRRRGSHENLRHRPICVAKMPLLCIFLARARQALVYEARCWTLMDGKSYQSGCSQLGRRHTNLDGYARYAVQDRKIRTDSVVSQSLFRH